MAKGFGDSLEFDPAIATRVFSEGLKSYAGTLRDNGDDEMAGVVLGMSADMAAVSEAFVKKDALIKILEAERDALKAEVDELCSRVCDECDGSGEYTLTDSIGGTKLCPCVCVGETDSYQRLKAERDALDAEVARLREFTGGGA